MNPNLKKTLRQILVPSVPRIFLILVLLMISTGLQALSPWPFKILLDNVLGHELIDTSTFIGSLIAKFTTQGSAGAFVVVSYFAISILNSLSDFIYSIYNNSVIQRITRAFAKACFDNLAKLDYGYFRKKNVGTYIYKLNYDVSAPGDIIESSILPIISSGLYLLFTIFILGKINFVMAVISLACLPLLTISLYFMNNKISTASTVLEKKNGTLYTFVEQVISQLHIIQAYTQQHTALKKYDNAMWTSLLGEIKLYWYSIVLTLVNGIIITVTYTVIIQIGIQRVADGTLSSGLLIVFIFYLDSIVSPVIDIIGAISSYKQSAARLKNTADVFDTSHHLKDTGTRTIFPSNDIVFDKVTVDDAHGKHILHNVSFTIPQGKLIAIIGKSGSGKSSLLQLLLRLSEATSGTVSMGGHPLNEYAVSTLRNRISYVPQETELFDEPIREIISFGKEDSTQADVERAADLAQASSFISKRPDRYEARVGEKGNMLSGGERQRLLLARAYLRNSPILLLDEIFSSQDAATQEAMMKTLRENSKDKTIIIVTHTYTVLEPNDHAIIIDKGQISAEGTFHELQTKHRLPRQDEE